MFTRTLALSLWSLVVFLSWPQQLCGTLGEKIQLGQKLSVGESWSSTNNIFAVGFFPAGNNMYSLAVWCNSESGSKKIVWSAMAIGDDRQMLLVSEVAELLLTNDALIVTEFNRTVWQTVIISCDQCIAEAQMSGTGNLMMLSDKMETLWQSFDSPTDTLLAGQELVGSMTLKSGKYTLEMNSVQVMLRYSEYPSQPYWSMTNNKRSALNRSLNILPRLVLSSDGVITFYDGTGNSWYNSMDDSSIKYALDYGGSNVVARRLTLDSSGSLQMFSLASGRSSWETVWKANIMECDIFGACGAFGVCSYQPHRTCRCPSGFHAVNESDPSAGCDYDVPLEKCDAATNEFVQLTRADYPWNDYNFDAKHISSMEACKESCLKDCECLAAAFKFQGSGLCFHKGKNGKLYNGVQSPLQNNLVSLKVSGGAAAQIMSSSDNPFVTDTSFINFPQGLADEPDKKWIRLLVLTVVVIESTLLVTLVVWSVWWWLSHRDSK